MRISELILEALETKQPQMVQIVAGWIEEYASGHPEAGVYCRRLMASGSVRVQTLVDVIAKFGTRCERKAITRCVRLALRRRKHEHQKPFRTKPGKDQWSEHVMPGDLFSMKARHKLNKITGSIVPPEQRQGRYTCEHKKNVQNNMRNRRAFSAHDWWFVAVLKQLLRATQP